MTEKCDLGLVGLAVMGENLALNMSDNGWRIAVFNRTLSKVDRFVARAAGEGHAIVGCKSLNELVEQLARPRRVMFMIKSGDPVPADEGLFREISPVDDVIAQLCELLSPGDVIIDGGNTHFRDTERRKRYVEARGLLYVGTGVSGGEAGARRGPSIMPGGSDKAWPIMKPIFESISAKAGADGAEPCVDWIGPGGAGHYVKMVHNGIEYGNMQLIAEAYWVLKRIRRMGNEEIGRVFAAWNRGPLQGYLIEITRDIFTVKDKESGEYLVDRILDRAGAKGTGKWTSQSAFDLGIPVALISAAVNARNLSGQKSLRVAGSDELEGPLVVFQHDREAFLKSLAAGLHLASLCSYSQGFSLLREASAKYGYQLDLAQVARIWRAGCIIRTAFLDDIAGAFAAQPELESLLLAPLFRDIGNRSHTGLREVVATAIETGISVPGLSAAIAYYDSLRSADLPANLTQAQRDYFGSHTYQRIDKEESDAFHSEWEQLRAPDAVARASSPGRRPRNLVVAQSGGPTCVINSSLQGVIEGARDFEAIGRVYGAVHGVEGLLTEELLDLTAQSADEVSLLRYTPAAGAIGSCRYKLDPKKDAEYRRILDVLEAHDVGYFIYIGGNDSMDTADKLSRYAADRGFDLTAVGVPKTIDNDLGDDAFKLIDHTPGYGSAARYWMQMVQNANQENRGMCTADPVLVMQAMGRRIGFIPAAARLADPSRQMPLLIYLPESPRPLEQLGNEVNETLKQCDRCLVVVSEGFQVGDLGAAADAFDHTAFGSSKATVCQRVVNYLNQHGLASRGMARGNVPGTDQRHAMPCASPVDLDEAYRLGQEAVALAVSGGTGRMATIVRRPGPCYQVRYGSVPLSRMANSERTFPARWIAENGHDVTDDFVRYAEPLVGQDAIDIPVIGGRQRTARFESILVEKTLTEYRLPNNENK